MNFRLATLNPLQNTAKKGIADVVAKVAPGIAPGLRPEPGARHASVHEVRDALSRSADSIVAQGMQFRVCRRAVRGSAARWQAQVLEIWRNARFREERYVALSLAGDKRAQPFQTLSAIKTYGELIVTGECRYHVDDIASHRIGPILRDYPRQCGASSPGVSRTICGSGARRFCASSA